ncbi:MAG: hypothetical protein JWN43_522 [Gammaproteobacteria bacterium]|nr:hypothetical protein [Gammaproteobacteria bacterium]
MSPVPHGHAGDEYDAVMGAQRSDRRVRTAFRERILRLVEPGSLIFDFGSGTGLDAKFYADQGYRVYAYDVDPPMCESFRQRCAEELRQGAVVLFEGSYREFRDGAIHARPSAVDAITANFAPLSLIDEPTELFEIFHVMMKRGGRAFISVLNPYFLGDMRYGWWWSNAPGFVRRGQFAVPGEQGSIHRRSLHRWRSAAAPLFTLEGVFPGFPAAGTGLRHLSLSVSRFMFLQYRKC